MDGQHLYIEKPPNPAINSRMDMGNLAMKIKVVSGAETLKGQSLGLEKAGHHQNYASSPHSNQSSAFKPAHENRAASTSYGRRSPINLQLMK